LIVLRKLLNAKLNIYQQRIMRKYNLTDEQRSRLIEIYPTTLTTDIASEFGVSIFFIRNTAHELKLYKSKEWIAETSRARIMDPNHPGRKTWIKKGSIPANKGKKQHEYMSEDAIAKTKLTRFKTGNIPPNQCEVGYERLTKDGYLEIRTEERFRLKHRVVWEQNFGIIPTGMNIQFKDGNRQNINIENLYMISKAKQLKEQNSMYARYPKEIQLLIQASGQLKRTINKKNKEIQQ